MKIILTSEVEATIVWDTIKAIMRGNLISLIAYMNKVKRLRYELELEKQKQTDKDIMDQLKEIRKQIDATLTDELEKKKGFTKQTFYRSGPKAARILARRLRTQQIKSCICKIRDPLSNVFIETASKNITSLYAEPDPVDDEMINKYLLIKST